MSKELVEVKYFITATNFHTVNMLMRTMHAYWLQRGGPTCIQTGIAEGYPKG